jgi:hypothetical protein
MPEDNVDRRTWVIVTLTVAVISAAAAIGAAILTRETPDEEVSAAQAGTGGQAAAHNRKNGTKIALSSLTPLSRDALAGSLKKEPATVTGTTTDDALLVESQTACGAEQSYNLASQFSRFFADIGIPDSVRRPDSVKFIVYLNGDSVTGHRAAYESVELGQRKHVDVSTQGAFRLTIRVEGVCADEQQAAWLNPTLIK